MDRVFVGLGSNMGDRLAFLRKAVESIGHFPEVFVQSVSSVYETEPVGNKNQPPFLNAVAELQARVTAEALLTKLKDIERSVGRTPAERWGPREIDLDLIYFGNVVVTGPRLNLPHPEVARRRFVLTPLAEIAPDFVDPLRRCSVRDMLQICPDTNSVVRISSTI